jgi:hypothetical protein
MAIKTHKLVPFPVAPLLLLLLLLSAAAWTMMLLTVGLMGNHAG